MGDLTPGRCFVVQDYLALAGHPALRAATTVAERSGTGSVRAPEQDEASLLLETRTAAFLGLPHATVHATGGAAIRAALRAVLAPQDTVIVDAASNSAMFETVLACVSRLHRSPPGSVEAVERRLSRLSARRGPGRLWVVVPAISAHASVQADLAELALLCRSFHAGLIVDVSQDLGAVAPGGGGVMEIQGVQGCADVVIGSFAECFGSPGGFVAFHDPALIPHLRHAQGAGGFPFGPVAKRILAAFDLIDGPDGARRRRRLHGNTLRLRNHLMADGLRVMGQPSPLVLVRLPPTKARAQTALVTSAGVAISLLGPPEVAGHAPRWRVILNADHGPADIDDLADLLRDVTRVTNHRTGWPGRDRQGLGRLD